MYYQETPALCSLMFRLATRVGLGEGFHYSYPSHKVQMVNIVKLHENKNVLFGLNLRIGFGIRVAVW